jgi:DNA invertase Pin-like site-specific DNA recombinase
MEEQLNSYEVQRAYYTDKISREPKWSFAGIYADKGITGTDALKRNEFQKMIRMCKRGKIDMIITKSISRFSRNTVDCLEYVRLLKSINVDVFFEEQGIHSKDNGAEFYITIYGSIAQSEAENISANVRWGKAHSAKEGKVAFHYNNFMGYRKGSDGKPEIVEEEAEIIRKIYHHYLMGDSMNIIAKKLTEKGIKTPSGKEQWSTGTVKSILTNEKYKGDALLNKTYVVDCISKKVCKNRGERPMYYVENNHPAIIDKDIFNRVQEEIKRRVGKKKVKEKGTKTELGKYSSKYALSELLFCGECGTPYRRCTWTVGGQKKIVWRCISRLDYGKKYCKNSPTIEETKLQNAIAEAIFENAQRSADVLNVLKYYIKTGLTTDTSEDKTLDLQIQIVKLEEEYNNLLNQMTKDLENCDDIEEKLIDVVTRKHEAQNKLKEYKLIKEKNENIKYRLDEIFEVLESLKNHPMEFDNSIICQILDCIKVESKDKIKIIFVGGYEVEKFID